MESLIRVGKHVARQSAPMATIPNLNTLRASRQSARGRGGARSVLNEGEGQESSEDTKDTVIQQTDQDASVSRLSAVSLGYLDDPFAKELFQLDAPRRYPIINRGLISPAAYELRSNLRQARTFAPRRSTRS